MTPQQRLAQGKRKKKKSAILTTVKKEAKAKKLYALRPRFAKIVKKLEKYKDDRPGLM